MKLIISDKNNHQLSSVPFQEGNLKIGSIIKDPVHGQEYKLTKFIEIEDHYIIFEGKKQ